jgi:hypothetical protein
VRWPAFVNDWGSTPAERAERFGCDRCIEGPDAVMFRAVDVAAPSHLVFRWLCQLRVAPYSYDFLDNGGRRSPRTLTPGLDRLEVGQRVATIFRLAAFEPGRSITLYSATPYFGKVAITYATIPVGTDRSRLVAKLLMGRRSSPFGAFMRVILPPGDLVMMRRQLLNLRDLAERDARAATAPAN